MSQPALELRDHCALCSSREKEVAIPFPDIPILRCQTCGFLYSGRVMPDGPRTAYYADHFGSRRHLLGQRLNAEMNFRVLQRISTLRRGLSVLDVGCGYGFLLRLLQDKGDAAVSGVELSNQAAAYANRTLRLDGIYANWDAIPAGQVFDLVISLEVIEHLMEPVEFVRSLFGRTAPGGTLVIMTDNFESAACRSMGWAFPKWIPHSHISHFTPATLRNCVDRACEAPVTFCSFTPWEMFALAARNRWSKPRPPAACFSLDQALATEMHQPFRLFALRRILNRLWVPFALKRNAQGSLLYAVVERPTSSDS